MIITIPKSELLKNQLTTPGWYRVRISKSIVEPSKDKTGSNLHISYKLEEGGKEIDKWWSLKPTALQFMGGFISAVNDPSIIEDAGDALKLDSDGLVGKRLWVKIKNREYQGNLLDDFDGFASIEKDMAAVPF